MNLFRHALLLFFVSGCISCATTPQEYVLLSELEKIDVSPKRAKADISKDIGAFFGLPALNNGAARSLTHRNRCGTYHETIQKTIEYIQTKRPHQFEEFLGTQLSKVTKRRAYIIEGLLAELKRKRLDNSSANITAPKPKHASNQHAQTSVSAGSSHNVANSDFQTLDVVIAGKDLADASVLPQMSPSSQNPTAPSMSLSKPQTGAIAEPPNGQPAQQENSLSPLSKEIPTPIIISDKSSSKLAQPQPDTYIDPLYLLAADHFIMLQQKQLNTTQACVRSLPNDSLDSEASLFKGSLWTKFMALKGIADKEILLGHLSKLFLYDTVDIAEDGSQTLNRSGQIHLFMFQAASFLQGQMTEMDFIAFLANVANSSTEKRLGIKVQCLLVSFFKSHFLSSSTNQNEISLLDVLNRVAEYSAIPESVNALVNMFIKMCFHAHLYKSVDGILFKILINYINTKDQKIFYQQLRLYSDILSNTICKNRRRDCLKLLKELKKTNSTLSNLENYNLNLNNGKKASTWELIEILRNSQAEHKDSLTCELKLCIIFKATHLDFNQADSGSTLYPEFIYKSSNYVLGMASPQEYAECLGKLLMDNINPKLIKSISSIILGLYNHLVGPSVSDNQTSSPYLTSLTKILKSTSSLQLQQCWITVFATSFGLVAPRFGEFNLFFTSIQGYFKSMQMEVLLIQLVEILDYLGLRLRNLSIAILNELAQIFSAEPHLYDISVSQLLEEASKKHNLPIRKAAGSNYTAQVGVKSIAKKIKTSFKTLLSTAIQEPTPIIRRNPVEPNEVSLNNSPKPNFGGSVALSNQSQDLASRPNQLVMQPAIRKAPVVCSYLLSPLGNLEAANAMALQQRPECLEKCFIVPFNSIKAPSCLGYKSKIGTNKGKLSE